MGKLACSNPSPAGRKGRAIKEERGSLGIGAVEAREPSQRTMAPPRGELARSCSYLATGAIRSRDEARSGRPGGGCAGPPSSDKAKPRSGGQPCS